MGHVESRVNQQVLYIYIYIYMYPISESITSLRSDPSSIGHVESYVNQQGYIYIYIMISYYFIVLKKIILFYLYYFTFYYYKNFERNLVISFNVL